MSDEMKNDSSQSFEDAFNSIREARKKKIESFSINLDTELTSDAPVKKSAEKYDVDDDVNFDDENTQRARARRKQTKNSYDEINSYSDENTKERIARDSEKAQKKKEKEQKIIAKQKGKKNRRAFRLMWLASVVVISILVSQLLLVGVNDMLAINRTDAETVKVEIPANPTLDTVAESLLENGIISSTDYFKLYANVTNASDGFRQGSFEMRKNMDYEAIINYLQSNSNRTDTVKVTFSEGMTVLEIAEKLHGEGVISDKEKFLELCKSNEFDEDFEFLKQITNSSDRYYKLEGYLYPDTYEFYVNEDPSLTISRFLSNFRKRVIYTKERADGFDKKVSVEQRALKTGYTLDEIITIASIIEAEAANEEDMYYISSILHNRLKSDVDEGVQTLDCDSTSFYPYRNKEDVPADIKTTFKSKYDTYQIKGLPAGPVRNPGMRAIEAAINPYDTDYLFFCHSAATDTEPSYAYYATNIYDHQDNLVQAGLTD